MTNPFSHYQTESARLAVYPDKRKGPIVYMGLAGETIELMEATFARDAEAIEVEAGDVLWYVAAVCDELGIELAEVVGHATMDIPLVEWQASPLGLSRQAVVNAGRVLECFKKHLRDGDTKLREDRAETIVDELAPLIRRVHLILIKYDSSLEAALARNLGKLVGRAKQIARGDS